MMALNQAILYLVSLLVTLNKGQIYPYRFQQCMDHDGDPLCIQQWSQVSTNVNMSFSKFHY